VNISKFRGKFLGSHKRPYLKQRDVAALELATKRQLERVILLALSVTINLLLHWTVMDSQKIKCSRAPGTHDEWFILQCFLHKFGE
jgi:hypothetical protein